MHVIKKLPNFVVKNGVRLNINTSGEILTKLILHYVYYSTSKKIQST